MVTFLQVANFPFSRARREDAHSCVLSWILSSISVTVNKQPNFGLTPIGKTKRLSDLESYKPDSGLTFLLSALTIF